MTGKVSDRNLQEQKGIVTGRGSDTVTGHTVDSGRVPRRRRQASLADPRLQTWCQPDTTFNTI